MEIYNVFKIRDLFLNPFLIIVSIIFFVFADIYLVLIFIVGFVFYQSFLINQFMINNDALVIQYPIRIAKRKIIYLWIEIKEIRVKKYGRTGLGSMPFMDIYIKNEKVEERKRIHFHSMDENEFIKFMKALNNKLPEGKLVVNSY